MYLEETITANHKFARVLPLKTIVKIIVLRQKKQNWVKPTKPTHLSLSVGPSSQSERETTTDPKVGIYFWLGDVYNNCDKVSV